MFRNLLRAGASPGSRVQQQRVHVKHLPGRVRVLEARYVLSPRLYALGLKHKHLPEMQKVCSLAHPPVFTPYICDFPCGMTVHVPLYRSMLQKQLTVGELEEVFSEHYAGCRFVQVAKEESGFLAANTLEGTNLLQVFVNGNDEQILLSARLDNLGKGASGAAVQNMNIALGLDEGVSL